MANRNGTARRSNYLAGPMVGQIATRRFNHQYDSIGIKMNMTMLDGQPWNFKLPLILCDGEWLVADEVIFTGKNWVAKKTVRGPCRCSYRCGDEYYDSYLSECKND